MALAGHIPQEKIDEVRLAADIVQVVGQRVRLIQKGKDFWGKCPFHGDTDPSFKVDRARGTWYCFGCGEGGSVFNFLMRDQGMTFPEAVKELAYRFGVDLPKVPMSPAQVAAGKKRQTQRTALEQAATYFSQQLSSSEGQSAWAYLTQKRGLSPEIIQEYGLGFVHDAWHGLGNFLRLHNIDEKTAVDAGLLITRDNQSGSYDRFRGRVMIPIKDAQGRLVSFGGRIMGDGEPKYLNGPESELFKKSSTLFNMDKALKAMRKKGRALVVEGYFDVITLASCGLYEACAPMGTALTPQQLKRLKGQCEEIYLVFDGDEAGIKAALRSFPVFCKANMTAKVLLLPQGEDPDSLVGNKGVQALEELLENAKPLTEFALERAVFSGDLSTPEGRSQTLAKAGSVITAIPDPVSSWLYLERLAKMLSVPTELAAKQLGIVVPNSRRTIRQIRPKSKNAKGLYLNDEECLIQMVISQPCAARLLAENEEVLQNLANDELRAVGECVIKVLHRGGDLTPASVAQTLRDQSLASLVSRLSESAFEMEEDKALQQTQLLIDQWQKRSLKLRRRDMKNAIAKAYSQGDMQEVARLQALRQRISKSNPTLNPGKE